MRQSKWSIVISRSPRADPLDDEVGVGVGRKTFSGGASNSRMIRTSGTSGSATISVSWCVVRGHDACSFAGRCRGAGTSSGIARRTSSRRR